LAIVDAMFTVKELMLRPVGTLFEPPDFVVEGPDDPQAAAIRATIAAKLTQPTLLLPSRIPDSFRRNGQNGIERMMITC